MQNYNTERSKTYEHLERVITEDGQIDAELVNRAKKSITICFVTNLFK